MAAAFIPDGYTTRIVAEAVEEVLDASGNVSKEFLSKCGPIPCRISRSLSQQISPASYMRCSTSGCLSA